MFGEQDAYNEFACDETTRPARASANMDFIPMQKIQASLTTTSHEQYQSDNWVPLTPALKELQESGFWRVYHILNPTQLLPQNSTTNSHLTTYPIAATSCLPIP